MQRFLIELHLTDGKQDWTQSYAPDHFIRHALFACDVFGRTAMPLATYLLSEAARDAFIWLVHHPDYATDPRLSDDGDYLILAERHAHEARTKPAHVTLDLHATVTLVRDDILPQGIHP